MSQFAITPVFDGGCCNQPGTPTAPVSNPVLYYNGALYANPTLAGITPTYLNLPAVCYDQTGANGTFGWNTALQKWV